MGLFCAPADRNWGVIGLVYEATGRTVALKLKSILSLDKTFCFLNSGGWVRGLHDLFREKWSCFQYNKNKFALWSLQCQLGPSFVRHKDGGTIFSETSVLPYSTTWCQNPAMKTWTLTCWWYIYICIYIVKNVIWILLFLPWGLLPWG